MSVALFVPDIPEFASVLEAARQVNGARVLAPKRGYWTVLSGQALRFERKPMKLGPALWNSLLSGGFRGHIREYGRDVLVIEAEGA